MFTQFIDIHQAVNWNRLFHLTIEKFEDIGHDE